MTQQAALLKMPESRDKTYHVLARKYRPLTFADLKGQDVLVQVLTNGLRNGRLPHAFILTGIRGVGKTTTARILARALNCTGRDLRQSVEPCGTCDACISIMQDHFIDVIEMDAASRTGIDDIREVIEAAKYKPVSGKYKVYIIDEVHMLSKNAFNGLLKTLEEPPAHVKFIFATTEIEKIPKTVLSRCMRFNLSRLDLKTLKDHFHMIAQKENFRLEDRAALLIARAADGSARDGMSLLDQALTMSPDQYISAQLIENMLGMSQQENILRLWHAAARGQAQEALDIAEDMYRKGNEPLSILHDLLNLTHTLTLIKIKPDQIDVLGLPELDLPLYQELQQKLTYPTLTRLWQLYLKGLEEVQSAPIPYHALQMLLIRVAYASTLPTPEEIIQNKSDFSPTCPPSPTQAKPSLQETKKNVSCFEDIIEIARQNREALLQTYLHQDVQVIDFREGHITLNIAKTVPEDFIRRLRHKLLEWTGQAWRIDICVEKTGMSVKMKEDIQRQQLIDLLSQESLVQHFLEAFPGAKIHDVDPTKH